MFGCGWQGVIRGLAFVVAALPVAAFSQEQGQAPSRYVFFDTAQVESAQGFVHTMNPAQRLGQVIAPDKPWDRHGVWAWVSVAEFDGAYHLWYDGVDENGRWHLCYAKSEDGLHWVKPELGLIEYEGSTANNIVYLGRPGGLYHGGTVFLDPHGDPAQRFKFVYGGGPAISPQGHMGVDGAVSPDGIHWQPAPTCPISPWYTDCGNVSFWDDARGKYVLYVRYWTGDFRYESGALTLGADLGKRAIGRAESDSFFNFPRPELVLAPDGQDPADLQFYNSAAHKYPWARDAYLLFIGAFYTEPDTVDVQIATSHDGITWRRDHRAPFLQMGGEGAFDAYECYMGHGMLPGGRDTLLMYYGGFNVVHGASNPGGQMGGIGCCAIRKDGFFSMDATYGGGELVTRPVIQDGERLTVNYNASAGGLLRIELQDEAGQPLPGYGLAEAEGLRGDGIDKTVAWKAGNDLSVLKGKKIRIRFVGRDVKLYAFGFAPFVANA